MNTTNANELPADDGTDFMAGFNSDESNDSAPAAKAPAKEPAAPAAPVENTNAAAPADQAPADPATDDDTGVDTANSGEQLPPQQEPEIDLTTLPDNVRQLVEKNQRELKEAQETAARQRAEYNALHGRLAPTQRRLEELQRQQQAPVAAQAGPQPTAGSAADAMAEAEAYYESEAFKDFERTWPVEAKLQKDSQLRMLRTSLARADQLERMISTEIVPQLRDLRADREESRKTAALSELEQQHPDWRQHNESDAFWNWFAAEEPYLNFASEQHRNQYLNDQRNVSHLLNRYKRETGLTQGNPPPAPAPAPAPAPNSQPRQNARLAMSSTPNTKGGAGPVRNGTTGVSAGDQFQAGFNSST